MCFRYRLQRHQHRRTGVQNYTLHMGIVAIPQLRHTSAETMIHIAFAHLLLRRIT
jgi:hypothetical protein